MPLLRPLLTLLIVIVTFASSGISSAIASSMSDEDDDCCAEKGESDKRDEGPSDDRCPPLCHACACSPTFSVPPVLVAVELIRELEMMSPLDSVKQPSASPPGPGVFHPPRVSVRA